MYLKILLESKYMGPILSHSEKQTGRLWC